MSPFTGCKKRKAWNKTREKYMPEERRQKVMMVIMIMTIIMKIWK